MERNNSLSFVRDVMTVMLFLLLRWVKGIPRIGIFYVGYTSRFSFLDIGFEIPDKFVVGYALVRTLSLCKSLEWAE